MKVDRLMSIVLILLDKERISAQELADRFEVSLRTIYRDIDAIDLAGVPIRSTPGVGGGLKLCLTTRWIARFFQQQTFPLSLWAFQVFLTWYAEMN